MEGRDLRPPPPPPNREDCWSEGSTSALIDAWGDRYLHLSRGNLRHKDWQEVADAVNSRRPSRTYSQCKNRIDTLKKKYKSEKSRIVDSGGSLATHWPFFSRLHALIANSPSTPLKNAPALPLELPRRAPTALPVYYSAAAAEDSVSSASSSGGRSSTPEVPMVKRWRAERDGVRQLAVAIERFAEVYEKVEEEKQRQMMELERKRMEFIKGLEFRRVQTFVDSQIQLERARWGDGVMSASGT